MKISRKLVAGGVASFAAAVGMLAGPFTVSTHATTIENIKEPQKILKLKTVGNDKVELTTDLDCSTHTLNAKVKNNTSAEINPKVTFDDHESSTSSSPIKPGKTGYYTYSYSGNQMEVDVSVKGDSIGELEAKPMVNCMEPVSFKVTDRSQSTVVGTLSNNSTIVPQTVYTKVGISGDVRVETLQPGESRTVSMPFNGMPEQTFAYVTIATASGYESSYSVDLKEAISIPEKLSLTVPLY